MRTSLVTKLTVVYLVPTVALVVLAPLLGYAVARRGLEEEVGHRLTSSAAMAAASLKPELLLTLQPGDEGNRTHRNIVGRLESLKTASVLERLYVFDRSRRLIAGTGELPPIGTPLPELERDRLEIERAALGEPTASATTFRLDGHTYKSGYAPVPDADGEVIVGADASAEFFAVLSRFRASMIGLAIACGLAGFGLFLAAAGRWLLRPIRALREATESIGRGDLATPVPQVSSDELGALAGGMDLMRERLFNRERELQMMLAGIAHEVRNPLGGIALFAGLLAEELTSEEEKLGHVRKIQRELAHLERLVEEFLGFAREPRLSLAPIEVRALFDEVVELAGAEAHAKHQALQVDAPSLSLVADAGALRRGLLNLVLNAVQAAPEGGHVTLRARRLEGRFRLSVHDDGPGVPEAERARLFTPFFTTRQKGLGLGLAFVRRIAEAHGGTARLGEADPGAEFVVELPDRAD